MKSKTFNVKIDVLKKIRSRVEIVVEADSISEVYHRVKNLTYASDFKKKGVTLLSEKDSLDYSLEMISLRKVEELPVQTRLDFD